MKVSIDQHRQNLNNLAVALAKLNGRIKVQQAAADALQKQFNSYQRLIEIAEGAEQNANKEEDPDINQWLNLKT